MASFTFQVFLVAVVALVGVSVARFAPRSQNGVYNFQMDSEEKRLFDFLLNPKIMPTTRLGAYSYKNCGDPTKESFVVQNLTFGPDPISFPGPLTVSFIGQIKTDVDAPLKAELLIERRVGSTWIKLPCIGVIGSCTYDDLCELLSGVTCPPPFVTHHVPCKCPFNKGSYSLPQTSIDVEAAVFPPGDYHLKGTATQNGNLVTCIDIMASFV